MRARSPFSLCVILVLFVSFDHLTAIRWLSLQHSKLKWHRDDDRGETTYGGGRGTRSGFRSPCAVARKRYGLAKYQAQLCRASMEIMPHVQRAAIVAARSCKRAFRDRRWNCSSIDTAPRLTPDLTRATREQAYVYAIGSASLVYTMAKACSSGGVPHCTCATEPTDALPDAERFKWGGCGDNVRWATKFAKRFVDTVEQRASHKRKRHDERDVRSNGSRGVRRRANQRIKAYYASAMNLHNNRVGRKVISANLVLRCKCHGISGSCNIKTCWKSIPAIEEIGQMLLRKFATAIEVSNRNRLSVLTGERYDLDGPSYTTTDNELIYLTKSPDYCTRDVRLGSLGTTGRKCNVTSNGTESCRQLCCGRGYRTVVEEKVERCHCKYHYCCYVTCETCKSVTQMHECS